MTGKEAAIEDLEKQQRHEKHQLAKSQLKDTFFLRRHQMLTRHQKVSVKKSTIELFKLAYTSGRKCLYSLVNYFYRIFECILMKPQINLFQKWTAIDRFPYQFLGYNRVNINIKAYGKNSEFNFWNVY